MKFRFVRPFLPSNLYELSVTPSQTVLKHLEHGAKPVYSAALASAGVAVARGILCDLRRAETKGDREKGIMRFEDYPSEYLDPLYIASYAATNGACAASDSGNTVSLEPFEDSNRNYSPFHNLLILYGALFRRFHQQPSMTLGSIITSPIDKYTLQLFNQIGHYGFFAGMKDVKAGIRITFASQALRTTGCKLAVTQVSEEEYQRLKKETAAAAGRTV
jgi:hypothetical protein